jgi:class 3 adenylate cyclase
MQRDHILLGEHLISETRSAFKLDILSKKLDRERKLSVALLEQMLPPKVADDLRSGRPVPPELFEEATIFFSDIVGFTSIASSLDPSKVVDFLNTMYTIMDNICASFGLYKVETIGDAYMVVGGLPVLDPEHVVKVANFAICVKRAVSSLLSPLDQRPIELRIGIHTGNVMAGIVGNLMPRYCLFGDTVNTASRMESSGEASRIHCSEAVANVLIPTSLFSITERGLVQIKGKGELKTFWVDGATEANAAANTSAQEECFETSKQLLFSTASSRPVYTIDKLVDINSPADFAVTSDSF